MRREKYVAEFGGTGRWRAVRRPHGESRGTEVIITELKGELARPLSRAGDAAYRKMYLQMDRFDRRGRRVISFATNFLIYDAACRCR